MQNGILYKQDSPQLFAQKWQEFVAGNSISPYYLLKNIEYLLAYSTNLEKDKSFVYLKNNQPVALVFLPIEKSNSITIGGGYLPAPIFLPQKDLQDEILENIDNIAKQEKIDKIMFRIDPLESQRYSYNYLVN